MFISVRVRNRRPRPTGVNWATLPPELSDLAPLRDLRRSQRLRDKRKVQSQTPQAAPNAPNGSSWSTDGSVNGAESTTTTSSLRWVLLWLDHFWIQDFG